MRARSRLSYNVDHQGGFLKGDFFLPGEAAAGHDDGGSRVVWVGSCDGVGRG